MDQVGNNDAAPFHLRLHRGEGMTLVAMNWRGGKPPKEFVGFAIEYREPGTDRFWALNNRLSFARADGSVDATTKSTLVAPIQKFRWVHFPLHADLPGEFRYRVTPVFMDEGDALSYGEVQQAGVVLRRETYPDQLNVSFTRGFVSSQAFVDHYEKEGPIEDLLPPKADDGLTFVPTHPLTDQALAWMGFEARSAILDVLDDAVADDTAQVRVVAYDLSEPDVVSRLEALGDRLKVIIDDSGDHGADESGETQAAERLEASAGTDNVKRQNMGQLQHNKTIVVDGQSQVAVCGSTNYSWRGFFVQNNNAVILQGASAIEPFKQAFDDYWENETVATFGATESAEWNDLGLAGIDAKVAFSPHTADNALLALIGEDITAATSTVFYSLAFLSQTQGPIRKAVKHVTDDNTVFVIGVSDKKTGGLAVQTPDGNLHPVSSVALRKNVPEPFKSEPTGGKNNSVVGTRMHHKFVVIDFDKPTARVYLGSYNFSPTADTKNGENLVLIRDPKIATSYAIEALRIFDHYHFRVTQATAKKARKQLVLRKPPRAAGEVPWWDDDFTVGHKVRDRKLFAGT